MIPFARVKKRMLRQPVAGQDGGRIRNGIGCRKGCRRKIRSGRGCLTKAVVRHQRQNNRKQET